MFSFYAICLNSAMRDSISDWKNIFVTGFKKVNTDCIKCFRCFDATPSIESSSPSLPIVPSIQTNESSLSLLSAIVASNQTNEATLPVNASSFFFKNELYLSRYSFRMLFLSSIGLPDCSRSICLPASSKSLVAVLKLNVPLCLCARVHMNLISTMSNRRGAWFASVLSKHSLTILLQRWHSDNSTGPLSIPPTNRIGCGLSVENMHCFGSSSTTISIIISSVSV